MSLDAFSVVQKYSKIRFSQGSAPDATGGALTASLDPIRLVELGEVEEVSPGLMTFWGPAVAEKK